jgi:hypothetical protein
MTFTSNIPFSGQSLGSSRTQVQGNFTNYFNLVSIDHVAPNAPGQGQHKEITFNTFGNSANFTQTGNQSYLYSFNATPASTSSCLVYQPSNTVMGTLIPVSPRAVCRAVYSGGMSGSWSLSADGPYGANSTFNVGSITSLTTTTFQVNFSQALKDSNYFIYPSVESAIPGAVYSIAEASKLATSFVVSLSLAGISSVSSVAIMVY